MKYINSSINNDKFWDNFAYKSILDELIKIINNNTKMDDVLKEELNQKFNELKEFMNKLRSKLKFNMDAQIEKLKENLMEKEKSLKSANNKLDKIYENLIYQISFQYLKSLLCPSGIAYEKKFI